MTETEALTGLPLGFDHRTLPPLGSYENQWRERMVTLCAHPTDPDKVVSIGKPWKNGAPIEGRDVIVCVEARSDYPRQLTYNDWSPHK